LTRNLNRLDFISGFANPNVEVCTGDLLNCASLEGFLKPSCTLIHLAFIGGSRDQNIQATVNIIEMAKRARIKRLVHCSTAVVVGSTKDILITEHTPPKPETDYQKTKFEIEELLRSELKGRIELAILRPTEIIGPDGQGLNRMIERLRHGSKLRNVLYHCILRERRFNFVSVHNVVSALMLLALISAPLNNEIYILSDDDDEENGYTAIESIINNHLGRKSAHALNFGIPQGLLSFLFKFRPGKPNPKRIYSHSKIKAIGYERVVNLRSAISEMMTDQSSKNYS